MKFNRNRAVTRHRWLGTRIFYQSWAGIYKYRPWLILILILSFGLIFGSTKLLQHYNPAIAATPTPPSLTQEAYIFENDDSSAADTNTAQAVGNTALTGVRKGERLNLRTHLSNAGNAVASTDELALFYDRNDGIWSKVTANQPPNTSTGNCTDTDWECTKVGASGGSSNHDNIAVAPDGTVWTVLDLTNGASAKIVAAQYVGSGGDCLSSAWRCDEVLNSNSNRGFPSIAFDQSGSTSGPWIVYRDYATSSLNVAWYVGDGSGTGCDSSNWNCETVDNRDDVGTFPSISFDGSGNPWIAYYDVTTADLVVATRGGGYGSTCTDTDWTCGIVDNANVGGRYNSIAFDSSGNAWVTYHDDSAGSLKVAKYVGGSSGNCSDTAWNCSTVDNAATNVGDAADIAFAPDGTAWVSYEDVTNTSLKFATYRGDASGSCTDTNWDCATVDNTANVGEESGIAFAPDGNAWISYRDAGDGTCNSAGECALRVAKYVGGTSGNCTLTSWDCADISSSSTDKGGHTSITFDHQGGAWISYDDGADTGYYVANTVRGGEITVAPALSASNGDTLSESHADITGSLPDATDRDSADCVGTTGTWNNGVHSVAENLDGLSLPSGSSTTQCTEIAWTIDTSQAKAGTTYRFVVASKDNWRADRGPWHGPVAIDNYPTLTIESDTDIRYSKDNTPQFADCTDTAWGCETIDSGTTVGKESSIAIAPDGQPWIAYNDDGTDDLMVAYYVGSGGSGCADSSAWTCETIDSTGDTGDFPDIAFDSTGKPWISYVYDPTTTRNLKVAQFVGGGSGSGCASSNWTCTTVDSSADVYDFTSIAINQADNKPWVLYYDGGTAPYDVRIAKYIGGTNGSGCASSAWDECKIIDEAKGTDNDMALDSSGNAWAVYSDGVNNALKSARYVGSGGSGCYSGVTDWSCLTIHDSTHNTGSYDVSLAFDSSGNPAVSYYEHTSNDLWLATYVGSGGNCNGYGGSTSWQCSRIDTTNDVGRYSALAYDATGSAWINYYDNTNNNLMLAHYVGGTSGNCSANTAWDCSNLDTSADVGWRTDMAVDPSGIIWISYYDNTNGALRVAKLHLPPGPPSADVSGSFIPSGDARYRLDDLGYSDVAANDTALDDMAVVLNQRPFYNFSKEFTNTDYKPNIQWIGQSTVSMATNNTTVEVYRFGTTNAWETLTTESSCAADTDCTINAVPTGTTAEYYEDVGGGEYAAYFRVWQDSHTTNETLKTDVVNIYQQGPGLLTQKAYILENDDGASADTNTAQVAADTSITAKKGERVNVRMQIDNTAGVGTLTDTAYSLFYDRNDGIWSKVGQPQPAVTGSGSGCGASGSSAWTCTTVDDDTDNTGQYSSLAFSPSGTPYISYRDASVTGLMVAQYVGSGGSGCGASGSSAWTCTMVDNDTDTPGYWSSLAFSPDGTPYVSYRDNATSALMVAQYVGSGGSGCGASGSSAWTCTMVDNDTDDTGQYTSLAFASDGTPYISYYDITASALKVAQYVGSGGSGCGASGSSAWTCTTVDNDTDDTGQFTSLAFAPDDTPYVSYRDGTATGLMVAQYVGSGGSGCGASGSSAWTCTMVDNDTDNTGQYSSLAFSPDGTPYISYKDLTATSLMVAQYVGGTSGSGCGASGSSAWTCTTVDNDTDATGHYTSLAFSPGGTPYVSYRDNTATALMVAQYVGGTSGSGCGASGSSAWTCTMVDNDTDNTGQYSSLAFSPDGTPYISYRDVTANALKVASLARGGEITVSPSTSASNGDTLSESHADMTSVGDTTNRDDIDCITSGAAFNSGKHFIAEEGTGVFIAPGDVTTQCTEISFTIDTSQATPGTTYRLVLASKDAYRPDKGAWRGPIAITKYPTITIAQNTDIRYSKDNTTQFTNCTDTDWGCTAVETSGDVGGDSALAFDPAGNPWISYWDGATNNDLRLAHYTGSNAETSCGGGSADWDCTAVETTGSVGDFTSLAFDLAGHPWISYFDAGNSALRVARYTGSNAETSCGGGSADWDCTAVEVSYDVGRNTSLAFDPAGNPWISYFDNTNFDLRVARYTGSNAETSCNGGSADWDCTAVETTNHVGDDPSLAFDSAGNPWISYTEDPVNDLRVARYTGSGTETSCGGGSADWDCTAVDTATSVGHHTALAFDPAGNPWISYYNNTNSNLRVARYTGSNAETSCGVGGSADWDCTAVETTNNMGWYSSLAFDPAGNPWISYYDNTNFDLRVARYTGSNAETSCNGGSADWDCTAVDTTNSVGIHPSLAFDPAGNPWVSYQDTTNTALRVAKTNLPPGSPSTTVINTPGSRNAGSGDARYRLSDGRSPVTDSYTGNCGGNSDASGYCGIFENQGQFDAITTSTSERPLYVGAVRFDNTSELPVVFWEGQSSLAPSTAGTSGDIVLQAYRFGTTNAWETVVSDSASTDCSTTSCQLSGNPTGTPSEYFETIGSDKWFYFRVYQVSNGSSFTFKVDELEARQTTQRLRGGRFFQNGDLKPLQTDP